MEAFRREGYGGTSIKDLERETGLSSGSLYNSFGDKNAIFRKALVHYNQIVVTERMDEHLALQSPVDGLHSLFVSLLDEPDGGSSGCLLTNSAIEFGAGGSAVKDDVEAGFQIEEAAFAVAIERLPSAVDAPIQALKLLALYQGILVLVRFGYPKAKLRDMINREFDTLEGSKKMTEALWNRYSASWSMPKAEWLERLAETVSPEITYTDPHITLTGIAAFSDYMEGFQANMPGTGFAIRETFDHHGRALSHWNMVSADKAVIGTGTSFAELTEDGKLAHITGFFGAP